MAYLKLIGIFIVLALSIELIEFIKPKRKRQ